jgi:hypothetical protein
VLPILFARLRLNCDIAALSRYFHLFPQKAMITNLLNRLFLLLTSRPVLIGFALALSLGAIPMLQTQWNFLQGFWTTQPTDAMLEDMEGLIDGVGGILVAAGVFLEERETLRKMAHRVGERIAAEETSHTQEYLNEIAHQNGMGLLLVGLFMEIGTLLVKMPSKFLDTNQNEKYIFAACLLLTGVSLFILFDFLKDYCKTYFLAEFKQH